MVTYEGDTLTLRAVGYGLLPASFCADQTPIGSEGSSDTTRLHPDDLAVIITAVKGMRVQSPWLSATDAAEYLRCPLSRVRKLTMVGELPCERDGRRVLYHRQALDDYVRAGGSKTP